MAAVSQKFNHIMLANLAKYDDIQIKTKVKELAAERKLTLREVSYLTGIRPNTVAALANGKFSVLNATHLILLMTAFNITDISDLIEVEMTEETYEKLSQPWEMTREREIEMEEAANYMRKQ